MLNRMLAGSFALLVAGTMLGCADQGMQHADATGDNQKCDKCGTAAPASPNKVGDQANYTAPPTGKTGNAGQRSDQQGNGGLPGTPPADAK